MGLGDGFLIGLGNAGLMGLVAALPFPDDLDNVCGVWSSVAMVVCATECGDLLMMIKAYGREGECDVTANFECLMTSDVVLSADSIVAAVDGVALSLDDGVRVAPVPRSCDRI